MSNGGSLRIRLAPKAVSGSVAVSCARYQSSSLSVREMRVALAWTRLLPQCSFSCSQIQTAWPRFCAARIMLTVVSLYALSESGGSTMNRIRGAARLLALLLCRGGGGLLEVRPGGLRHEHHRARHFGVGERGVAAL